MSKLILDPANWRWANFTPDELRCKHTGKLMMDPNFLDRLQKFRTSMGFPFPINSGFRDATHPIEARKAQPGSHFYGRAVDIGVNGMRALTIMEKARAFGFTGIGLSQTRKMQIVHLDDMLADEYHASRPALWTY